MLARSTTRGHSSRPAVPQGCTHLKVRQAGRCLTQHYDAFTSAAGLKTTQYSLLSNVMRLEPVQPTVLAAALNLDASTLTRNLRPLIDHGWLELRPGPDARSRRIVSTPAGRTVRAEAQRYWRAAQESLNERLGVETVGALHELLDQVLAAFGEPTRVATPSRKATTPAGKRRKDPSR